MSESCVYTVSAQAHYDSAHFLVNYQGKCERLHGHRYVVEAAVQSAELNEAGIAFDFVDLKRALRALADYLDHELLNELPEFQGVETSAENQAKNSGVAAIPGQLYRLAEVEGLHRERRLHVGERPQPV